MKIKSFFVAGVLAASAATPAMAQVTSVTQLRDVQPSEWSYQAISNLVSRYGCVAGFENSTFRPGQPATRAQLAALTSACLDSVVAYQTEADAQLAASLRSEFAKEIAVTNTRVATLESVAAKKSLEVGNYLGAAVLLNQQGVDGPDYTAERTVAGGTIQGRYAVKTFANQNAVSVRPYVNFVAGPDSQIGAGGGALLSYDFSLARKAGVSTTNLYLGAGYQVPFSNNTEANYQSAVGQKGQVILAVGVERRLTNSLTGFMDLKFPTTNASYNAETSSDNNKGYSPVLTAGVGFRF